MITVFLLHFECMIYLDILFLYRRDLELAGEIESLKLEGDIGGGLVLQREISFPKDDPKVFRIESGIVAQKVGGGSGGYSRLDLILLLSFGRCPLAV